MEQSPLQWPLARAVGSRSGTDDQPEGPRGAWNISADLSGGGRASPHGTWRVQLEATLLGGVTPRTAFVNRVQPTPYYFNTWLPAQGEALGTRV